LGGRGAAALVLALCGVYLFLLVSLLIPAYEVVLEFGIAIDLIALGVWLSRER